MKLKLRSTTDDLEELQSSHAKLRHAYSQLQRDSMTLAVRSTERDAILGNGTLADTIKGSLEQMSSSETRKKRKRKPGRRRTSVASSVVSSVRGGGGAGYEDDGDDELGAHSFSRAFNMIASKIAGGGPSSSSSSVPSSSWAGTGPAKVAVILPPSEESPDLTSFTGALGVFLSGPTAGGTASVSIAGQSVNLPPSVT